jgi:hypothetical protein
MNFDAVRNAADDFFHDKQFTEVEHDRDMGGTLAPFYAHRTGSNLGLFRYHDFILIHDGSRFIKNPREEAIAVHNAARRHADSFFKLPKAFRLTVPNIITIICRERDFPQEMIVLANEHTRTMVGGEFHCIYLINTHERVLYGQGISRTRVQGVPFVSSIEFKKVDPQNRGYRLVAEFADRLFHAD